jgi:hypothetical protein
VKRTTMTWAGLGVGACLAAGLVYPAIAAAEDTPSPTATPRPSTSASKDPGEGKEARRSERQAALASKLATELGVPEDRVLAALKKIEAEEETTRRTERLTALKERLAQAVKDGKLTEAQADAVLKAAESGAVPFGGPGHGPRR